MPLELLACQVELGREDKVLGLLGLGLRAFLAVDLGRRTGDPGASLGRHVVEAVEVRVQVGQEELRRKRGDQSLGVRAQVGRDLARCADADVLEQTEHEQGRIERLAAMLSCALAPEPALVMVDL